MEKATFSQNCNDLHWKFWAGEDGFIRWGGYDDTYWWNFVSKADHTRNRTGTITGRTFRLNFQTGEVEIFDSEGISIDE